MSVEWALANMQEFMPNRGVSAGVSLRMQEDVSD